MSFTYPIARRLAATGAVAQDGDAHVRRDDGQHVEHVLAADGHEGRHVFLVHGMTDKLQVGLCVVCVEQSHLG